MKIIKVGTQDVPWWVGQQVTCAQCGQVHELEAGDEQYGQVQLEAGRVTLECLNCRTRGVLAQTAAGVRTTGWDANDTHD